LRRGVVQRYSKLSESGFAGILRGTPRAIEQSRAALYASCAATRRAASHSTRPNERWPASRCLVSRTSAPCAPSRASTHCPPFCEYVDVCHSLTITDLLQSAKGVVCGESTTKSRAREGLQPLNTSCVIDHISPVGVLRGGNPGTITETVHRERRGDPRKDASSRNHVHPHTVGRHEVQQVCRLLFPGRERHPGQPRLRERGEHPQPRIKSCELRTPNFHQFVDHLHRVRGSSLRERVPRVQGRLKQRRYQHGCNDFDRDGLHGQLFVITQP